MNPPTMMRLDPDTRRRMKELAVVMGPVKPLTISDVVRECVRRVHESDIKTKEKQRYERMLDECDRHFERRNRETCEAHGR